MKKMTPEQQNLQAQNELLRLEKDFRSMVNDDEATKKREQLIIAKQKILIKLLEKERNELKTTNPDRPSNVKKRTTEIEDMLEEYTKLKDKINSDSFILEAISLEIKKAMDEIHKLRKIEKVGEESVEETIKQDKLDDNLEEKLHVETQKFNRVLIENEKLRNEIDAMLQERERFNRTFFSLTSQLQAGKKMIFDLIEQGTAAFDNRENSEARLVGLRNKAKTDLLRNCLEFEDSLRKLSSGMEKHAFIEAKSQKRVNDRGCEKEKNKIEMNLAMGQKFKEYQSLVAEVRKIFSENDLERIVMQFRKLEEDNYNIFSFVNEQNKRLNAARQEICDIHNKITNQRLDNERTSASNSEMIENFEKDYKKGRYEVLLAKRQLEKSEKTFNKLLSGIGEIFAGLSCDIHPIDRMLGDNSRVKPSNVKYYLKNIEDRLISLSIVHKYQLERMMPRKSTRMEFTAGSVTSDITAISDVTRTSFINKFIRIDKRDAHARTVVAGTPCPLCAEVQDISEIDESFAVPVNFDDLRKELMKAQEQAEFSSIVHPVENCPMPAARKIVQSKLKT